LLALRRFNSRKEVFSPPGFSSDFLQVIIRDSCIATFIAKQWRDEADGRPAVKEEVLLT
jgi:hypothetical protein